MLKGYKHVVKNAYSQKYTEWYWSSCPDKIYLISFLCNVIRLKNCNSIGKCENYLRYRRLNNAQFIKTCVAIGNCFKSEIRRTFFMKTPNGFMFPTLIVLGRRLKVFVT